VVSGELEQSLRGAVDEYISSRLRGLQEEITRLQGQVNEAFTQLAERAGGEGDADASVAASISEHIRAAHSRGIEDAVAESARTRASSDIAILKAGIEDLSEQHSQAEILSTLVNRAASKALSATTGYASYRCRSRPTRPSATLSARASPGAARPAATPRIICS